MLSREKWLQDTVDHTFLAFQGVTIGCAKCHDHMFDPITQKEYYEVRAIFTPHNVRIDRVPGQPDTKLDGLARVYDAEPNAQTFLLIRGDDRNPDKTPLPAGVPAALGGKYAAVGVNLPISASVPDRRHFVIQDLVRNLEDTLPFHDKEIAATQKARWMAQLIFSPHDRPFAAIVRAGMQPQLDANYKGALMAREAGVEAVHKNRLLADVEALEDEGKSGSAEWKKVAEELVASERWFAYLKARNKLHFLQSTGRPIDTSKPIEPQLAEAKKELAKAESDLSLPPSTQYTKRDLPKFPTSTTGRRAAFAHWLADKNNPLTARVAVNHIWLRHFGQAIEPSVFDFGRNGRPPSHPALLDWLAAELMTPAKPQAAWSMKHLHRLIITSATYRQSSTSDPADAAIDRDNKYLWHMPPRRLEAEVVRDEILYVAGKLDQSFSGPDIDQNLGMTNFRRSLYFRHAAEKEMEFLKLFDAASVTECYQRKESVIPQQALALSNSELTIRMARLLARALAARHSDAREFVTTAFERTLTRPPTANEMSECLAFLEQQQKAHSASSVTPRAADAGGHAPALDPALRARENLVQVLFNHHEFVTVR
jgi:hypothetical protein